MYIQGFIALLQFVPIQLKSLKPKETDFEPHTLGDHVRRRRLELKLTQKEVADRLGVVPWTILNWEKGYTEPPIASIPAIVRFLGYDPFPQPRSLTEHLFAKRRVMGWSIKEAARVLGVDPGSWEYRWFKRYIGRNPRVLNGYAYQVFSQIAAQSEHI